MEVLDTLNHWQAQANTPRSNLLILNKHLGYCSWSAIL